MLTTIFYFLFLLVQKGATSFTSTPPSKTFYTPPDSVSLKWTFDPSFNPVIITFSKFDQANNVYDDLVNYIIPIKRLTVYLPGDQPRMDMYGQATLRINDTTAADAGKYKCKLTSNNGVLESVAELAIRGTTSNAYQSTPVLENSPSAIRLRVSSKLLYSSSERVHTASEAYKKTAASDQRLFSSDQRLASSEQRLTSSDQRVASSDQRLTSSEQRLTSRTRRVTENSHTINEITRIVAETTESYKVLENPTSSLQQSVKPSKTLSEHGKSTSVMSSLQFRLNSPIITQSSQTLAVAKGGSSLETTTQSTNEVSFQHPMSVSFAIIQTLTTKVNSDVVIESNASNFPVNPTTHLKTEETTFSSTIPFLKTSLKSDTSSYVTSNRTSFIAVSHSGTNYQYEASSFEASKLVLVTRFSEIIYNNTSPVYISTASQSRSHHGHEAASSTANSKQASTIMVSYSGNTWTNSLRQATTTTTTVSNKKNTNSTFERRSRERDRTILAMALGIPFFLLLSCGGIILILRTRRRRKTKYLTQGERCENRNDKSLEKSAVIINLKSIKMTNSSYDLHSK